MASTDLLVGLGVLIGLIGIVVPVLPGSILILGAGEPVGLVHEVDGNLTKLVFVLARVVSAEEKLAAGVELDAKVGLGTAAVAAVLGAQHGS